MEKSAVLKMREDLEGKILYDLTVHVPELEKNDEEDEIILFDQYPCEITAVIRACLITEVTDTGALVYKYLGEPGPGINRNQIYTSDRSFLNTKEQCLQEIEGAREETLRQLKMQIEGVSRMSEKLPQLQRYGITEALGDLLEAIESDPNTFVKVRPIKFPEDQPKKAPSMKM